MANKNLSCMISKIRGAAEGQDNSPFKQGSLMLYLELTFTLSVARDTALNRVVKINHTAKRKGSLGGHDAYGGAEENMI